MRAIGWAWVLQACSGTGVLGSIPEDPAVPEDPDVDEIPAEPPVAGDPTGDTGTTVGVPTDPPQCAGLPGAPGDHARNVRVDGQDRSFLLHVPGDLDPDVPAPVVLVFHGYTMSGEIMADVTTWSAVADREGFVVVYANGDTGLGGPWNVGSGVCGNGAFVNASNDDFGFVEAMLASLEQDLCVDRDRVFGSGFSMGAYFVHHLACRGPGIVRAIAPHSGGTYDGACDNGPVPVLVLHGTSDPLITDRCGDEATELWVARDGCDPGASSARAVEGGTCEVFEACDPGGAVTHCAFAGMDHGWAGSSSPLYGGGAGYADAAELSWAFFESVAP